MKQNWQKPEKVKVITEKNRDFVRDEVKEYDSFPECNHRRYVSAPVEKETIGAI